MAEEKEKLVESEFEKLVRQKGLDPSNPEDLNKIATIYREVERKVAEQGNQASSYRDELKKMQEEIEKIKKEREDSGLPPLSPEELEQQRMEFKEQWDRTPEVIAFRIKEAAKKEAKDEFYKEFIEPSEKKKLEEETTLDEQKAISLMPGETEEEKSEHFALITDDIEQIIQEYDLSKNGYTAAVQIYFARKNLSKKEVPPVDTGRGFGKVPKTKLTSSDLEKMSHSERMALSKEEIDRIIAEEEIRRG